MCFSPEASFAGGVIISAIGLATVKKVHKPSQIVFASIPLFFGAQQFIEGFVWLSFSQPEFMHYHRLFTTLFLLFADVFWPMMIPLAVLHMEKNDKRKKILRILLVLGLSVSLYYGYCLLFFNVTPQIMGYHIQYTSDYPKILSLIAFVLYLITSITPLFVSTIQRTKILGIFMSLSCLVTLIFFTQFLTSVWCFFAALISAVIYWILRDAKRVYILDKAALEKVLPVTLQINEQ